MLYTTYVFEVSLTKSIINQKQAIFQIGNKVHLSLSLIKHHAIKRYGEVEIQLHIFLTLALHTGGWLL
jgi:hypothetical protein